jgi:hypothetical protein
MAAVLMTLICLMGLSTASLAEGNGIDPPPPNPPADTTIAAPVAPGDTPDETTQGEEASLWDEFLELLGL